MNASEFLRLPVRERDALVAQKIMGLVPCDKWQAVNMGSAGGPCWQLMDNACEHWSGPRGKRVSNCYAVPDPDWPYSGPRNYTTDIACAWEVVEKLRANRLGLVLNDASPIWRAAFLEIDEPMVQWAKMPSLKNTAWQDTAPLTICVAALKVKGIIEAPDEPY